MVLGIEKVKKTIGLERIFPMGIDISQGDEGAWPLSKEKSYYC